MITRELLDLAYARVCKDRADKCAKEKGTYHVGGGGVILEDGRMIGGCPRKVLLRSLGIECTEELADQLMMLGGRANEIFWQSYLEAAGGEKIVLREGDLSLLWKTVAGTSVTGHPDGFIATLDPTSPVVVEAGKYQGKRVRLLCFIELKRTSTLWKTRDRSFDRDPDSDHVIQAAHYCWKLGELQGSPVNAELWYTQDVKFYCPADWAALQNTFRKEPTKIEMSDKGKVKDIIPHFTGYEMKWEGNYFIYRHENESTWKSTVVTKEAIGKYYDNVDQMQATKKLGSRPADQKISGKKMGWSNCNPKYCPFANACDNLEHDFEAWLAECKRLAGQ